MNRLAQTAGLTDVQQQILATVREFVDKEIIPHAQVLIGNEEDFQKALGFEVEGTTADLRELPVAAYKRMVLRVVKTFPNIQAVCTTLREVKSGLVNNWSAILWLDGAFSQARPFKDLEIEDRVGGGDGFSSGIAAVLHVQVSVLLMFALLVQLTRLAPKWEAGSVR